MRESKQRNSPLTGLRGGLALAALAMMTALVLGGCGGSSGPVVQIPADPQAASKAELQALFDEISLQLQSAKPSVLDTEKVEEEEKQA